MDCIRINAACGPVSPEVGTHAAVLATQQAARSFSMVERVISWNPALNDPSAGLCSGRAGRYFYEVLVVPPTGGRMPQDGARKK